MTPSEILSVRIAPRTRRLLEEAAMAQTAAGASAMAREILEQWADEQERAATRQSVQTAVSYLQSVGGDWDDETSDFFGETEA